MIRLLFTSFIASLVGAAAINTTSGDVLRTKKTHTTSRGMHYTYYTYPGNTSKPTLLLQHGWPDSAALWDGVVPSLTATGHPLLVPDMLGYGGTSKPSNTSDYNSKSIAADLIELCDAENARSIVSVGHDWGSYTAQRMHLWYPERVSGLVMLAVAYAAPDNNHPFNLTAVQALQQQVYGGPLYAYWSFFLAPDAAALAESRLEAFFTVMHGTAQNWVTRTFLTFGGIRSFLNDDGRVPLRSYAVAIKKDYIDRLRRDGFAAPFQWYRVIATNVNHNVEKQIPKERYVIDKPTLFISGSIDAVCRTDLVNPAVALGQLPKLKSVELQSSHWLPLEKPKEVGSLIATFLKDNERELA